MLKHPTAAGKNIISKLDPAKLSKFVICVGLDGCNEDQHINNHLYGCINHIKQSKCNLMILSNQSHMTEPSFASFLSEKCNMGISHKNVVMPLSPLKLHTSLFSKPVLGIGPRSTLDVLRSAGYINVFLLHELEAAFQSLSQDSERIPKALNSLFQKFESVFLMNSPNQWKTSIGMLISFLAAGGCMKNFINSDLETLISQDLRHPDLYVFNRATFIDRSVAHFSVSQGCFAHMLETTYESVFKRPIVYKKYYGKPYLSTYKYLLERIIAVYKKTPERIYFIGPDSATDIVGANNFKNHCKSKNIAIEVISYHCGWNTNSSHTFFMKNDYTKVGKFLCRHSPEFVSEIADYTVSSPYDAVNKILERENIFFTDKSK